MKLHLFYDNGWTYMHYNELILSTLSEIFNKTDKKPIFCEPNIVRRGPQDILTFQKKLNDTKLIPNQASKSSIFSQDCENKHIMMELEEIIKDKSRELFDEVRFINDVEDIKKREFLNQINSKNKDKNKFFDDYVLLITDKYVDRLGYKDPIIDFSLKKRNKIIRKNKKVGLTIAISTAIAQQMTQLPLEQRKINNLENYNLWDESNSRFRVYDELDFMKTIIFYEMSRALGVCSKAYEKKRTNTKLEQDMNENYCNNKSCIMSLRTNDFKQILDFTKTISTHHFKEIYCSDCSNILSKINSKKSKSHIKKYQK